MSENDQLELGPIERLDGQGNPISAPSLPVSEQSEYSRSLEAPLPPAPVALDSSDEYLGDLEGGELDPLGENDEEDFVHPEQRTLEQAAELLNIAAAGGGIPLITPADALRALSHPDRMSAINRVLGLVRDEDAEVNRGVLLDSLENPAYSPQDRLAFAQEASDEPFDANVITRQAMHNVAIADLLQEDTPAGEEHYAYAAEAAEEWPKNIEVLPEAGVSEDVLRAGYYALLDHYYTKAEEGATFLAGKEAGPLRRYGLNTDFMTSVLPFRFQVPVVKIFNALGLDTNLAMSAGGTFLMGTALQKIREHIDTLPTEKKIEALSTMLRILKPNSGVFKDGNDWVTAHVLSEAFETDIRGKQSDPLLARAAANLVPGNQEALKKKLGHLRFNTLIDNAGSILDLSLVGGVLQKGTMKFGAKLLPSSLRALNKVAPQRVSSLLADALSNPAVRERFVDLAGEDIVAQAFPSVSAAYREGGVELFSELLSRQLDITGYMGEIAGRTNLSMQERAAAYTELRKVFEDFADQPTATLHLSKSLFEKGPQGLDISAVFGRTKDKGWATLGSAQKAKLAQVEELFGVDPDVRIVMKDKVTGRLIEPPANVLPTTRGEFFLQAKDFRAYEGAENAYNNLIFGADDIAPLTFAPSSWKVLKALGLGWTNPGSRFSANIMDSLSTVPRGRIEWNRLTSGLLHSVVSLKTPQLRKLSKVIKDGEIAQTATGVGKHYSPSELAGMGLDQATQRAYYAYRSAADFLWTVVNRQTRTRMMRDGLKDIHAASGRVGFGKPLRQQDAIADLKRQEGSAVLDVFDPATGKFVELNMSAVEEAYKNGSTLARLSEPMLGKAGEATHVLVDSKAGSMIKELPRAVTPRIAGYYPHMWEGNFVVYGRTAKGNEYAIGLAATEADARKVARAMEARRVRLAGKGKPTRFTEVGYRFDRSLSEVGHRGAISGEVYRNMGGPIYGSRNGGKLANFSKREGDILVEPIEALLRGFELVGQSVTKGEMALSMKRRLYNFIQTEGLKLEKPGMLPDPVANRIVVESGSKAQAYKQAQAYLDQIEFNLRLPDAADQAVSTFFRETSSIMDSLVRVGENFTAAHPNLGILAELPTKALRKASKGAASLAAKAPDPLAFLGGLVFRGTISADFLRQGPLQASQLLIMSGVAPKAFSKAAAQLSGIAMLASHRSTMLHGGVGATAEEWRSMLRAYSKLVPGMPVGEVEKVVDTLFTSGLLSAVGHHTYMRSAMRSFAEDQMRASASALSKGAIRRSVGGAVRRMDDLTFGTASKIGFEAGENINQIGTFLTLYNRDKAKGIANLDDPDYVKRLVGLTSELTGNMIPENSFPFQRGLFKNAFQFTGFQLKMLFNVLPKSLGGSRTLSTRDKWGLVLGQFFLYGRRATAYTDALYRIIDTKVNQAQAEDPDSDIARAWHDPATKAVLDGLLIDWTTNKAVQAITGQDTEYDISGSFAPGGGAEFLMDRLAAFAGEPGFEAYAGLSGKKYSKVAEFVKKAADISLARYREHDTIPVGERVQELAWDGASVLDSGASRYLLYRQAEALEGWVGSGGTVSETYSGKVEGRLFAVFGIKTKDRIALEEALDKYEDLLHNSEFKKSERDEMVDTYYKDLLDFTTKLNLEATADDIYNNRLDQWTRQRGLLFSLLPPDDAEYVYREVNRKLRQSLSRRNTTEQALVERMVKIVDSGRLGKEGPEALMYLENVPSIKRNPRLVELIRNTYMEAVDEETP